MKSLVAPLSSRAWTCYIRCMSVVSSSTSRERERLLMGWKPLCTCIEDGIPSLGCALGKREEVLQM